MLWKGNCWYGFKEGLESLVSVIREVKVSAIGSVSNIDGRTQLISEADQGLIVVCACRCCHV